MPVTVGVGPNAVTYPSVSAAIAAGWGAGGTARWYGSDIGARGTTEQIQEEREKTGVSESTAAYNLSVKATKEAAANLAAAAKEAGGSSFLALQEAKRQAIEAARERNIDFRSTDYLNLYANQARVNAQAWDYSGSRPVRSLQDMADKWFQGDIYKAAETLDRYGDSKTSSTSVSTDPEFQNLPAWVIRDFDRYTGGLGGGVYEQKALAEIAAERAKQEAEESPEITPVEKEVRAYFKDGYIVIGDYAIEEETFKSLPQKYRSLAVREGLDVMKETLESDNAALVASQAAIDSKYNNALSKLEGYKEGDGYQMARYLRDTGDEATLKTLGVTDAEIAELKKHNYEYLGTDAPERVDKKTFIKDYFESKGWKYVTRGTAFGAEDLEHIDAANAAYDEKYSPPMTLDQYQLNYFQDKGWDTTTPAELEASGRLDNKTIAEYYKHQDEATKEYARLFGTQEVISQGIEKMADLVIPGAYLARNWNELSATDKAVNIAIDVIFVATLFGPGASRAARGAYNVTKRSVGEAGTQVIDKMATRLRAGVEANDVVKVVTEGRNMIKVGQAMKAANIPGGEALIERGTAIANNPNVYIRTKAVKASGSIKEGIRNLSDESLRLAKSEGGFIEIAERQGKPVEPLREGPRVGEKVKVGEYPVTREEARLLGITDDEIEDIIRKIGTDREAVLKAMRELAERKKINSKLWDDINKYLEEEAAKPKPKIKLKERVVERNKPLPDLRTELAPAVTVASRGIISFPSEKGKQEFTEIVLATRPQKGKADIKTSAEEVALATKQEGETKEKTAVLTMGVAKVGTGKAIGKSIGQTEVRPLLETRLQPAAAQTMATSIITEPATELFKPTETKKITELEEAEKKPARLKRFPDDDSSDEDKRSFLESVRGFTARRRGELNGKPVYRVRYYPYGPKDKLVLIGEAPPGAREVRGKGSVRNSAYVRGEPPRKEIYSDTGAIDDIIIPVRGGVTIKSVKDLNIPRYRNKGRVRL